VYGNAFIRLDAIYFKLCSVIKSTFAIEVCMGMEKFDMGK
jgi:hypothetical protein